MSTNLTFATTLPSVSSFDREIDQNQRILENLGNSTDRVLEKIDIRITDPEQSERIEQKQEEIQELVDQAQEVLEESENKKEIQGVVQETKNIIAIKVESAITPTTDITENIGNTISLPRKDIEQAKETLIESLEADSRVRIMYKPISKNHSFAVKSKNMILISVSNFNLMLSLEKKSMNSLSPREVSSNKNSFQIPKQEKFRKVFSECRYLSQNSTASLKYLRV